MKYHTVIIGGGASGLFAASVLASHGKSVLVLERSEKPGKKILISGGGRCNFTNTKVSALNFVSVNRHFCKSALSRYTPEDFIALTEQYGIKRHEKHKGQLFCTGKSSEILEMLLKECEKGGAEIRCNQEISNIEKSNEGFIITSNAHYLYCKYLVIATGGKSIPQMGATDYAYIAAKQFGINVLEPYPALVGLHPSGKLQTIVSSLSGVSLPVRISSAGMSFEDDLLFTHKGLSGPAVLQISTYCKQTHPITINFLPTVSLNNRIKTERESSPKTELVRLLSRYLPKRFVQEYYSDHRLTIPISQLSKSEVEQLTQATHEYICIALGTDGFARAEVTGGGIDTDELSSKTFETKKVPGLFFIGESIDVTGWLGGYNFQWAWSSGYCVALALSEKE